MGTTVSSLQDCCKDEIKGRICRIDAQNSDQMVASRKMSVCLALEPEKVTLCGERVRVAIIRIKMLRPSHLGVFQLDSQSRDRHPWDGGQRHMGMMQIWRNAARRWKTFGVRVLQETRNKPTEPLEGCSPP